MQRGWSKKVKRLLVLWMAQMRVNQEDAAREAERYRIMYRVFGVAQSVATACTFIDLIIVQARADPEVLYYLVVVALVTSGVGALSAGFDAIFRPLDRVETASRMSVTQAALARRIDIQLQLTPAERVPAVEFVAEIIEQYDAIVSDGSKLRLEHDLPSAAAVRAWAGTRPRALDGASTISFAHHVARVNDVATDTSSFYDDNTHGADDDDGYTDDIESGTAAAAAASPSSSPPSRSSVLRAAPAPPAAANDGANAVPPNLEQVIEVRAVAVQQPSRALARQLEYQMSRLVDQLM